MPRRPPTITTTTTTPRPNLDGQSLAEMLRYSNTRLSTLNYYKLPEYIFRNILRDESSEENEDYYYDEDEEDDENYDDYEVDLETESLRNKHVSQIPTHPEPYYYGDT